MRNGRLGLFMVLLTFGWGLACGQSITVTSPNGGEKWESGSLHAITWTTSGINAGTFRITLWKAGSSLGVVATGLPHTQHAFNWNVGSLENAPDATAEAGYTIKVRLQGEPHNDFSDASFSIIAPLDRGMAVKPAGIRPGVVMKPDLAVDSHKVEPANPRMGDTVQYTARIMNGGNVKSSPTQARLKLSGVGTGFKQIPVIGPGKTFKLKHSFTVKRDGPHKLNLLVDHPNIVDESNEGNNAAYLEYNVTPLPDLVVCVGTAKMPRPGKAVSVHAFVRNVGEVPSGPCKLEFYVQYKGTDYYDIPPLQPGEIYFVKRNHSWSRSIYDPDILNLIKVIADYIRFGNIRIKGVVDYMRQVDEAREDNNIARGGYCLVLPGGPHGKKGLVACSDGTDQYVRQWDQSKIINK